MKFKGLIKAVAKKIPVRIIGVVLLMFWGYILLHDIFGGTLLEHESSDSYTLQAKAWTEGDNIIRDGEDYTWLELAVYEDDYYVSFPPVPTVFWLPFIKHFGEETPNNLFVALYTIIAFIGAYKACRASGMDEKESVFWSLFSIMATNIIDISANGGVWYQAQTLNIAFVLWAIYCAMKNRRVLSMVLLALSVGCRPFSAIFIPIFIIFYYRKDSAVGSGGKPVRIMLGYWKIILPVIVIGAAYMVYNYVRFDNPFEFGHNYLPGLTKVGEKQFGFVYLKENLNNIFCRPVKINSKLALEYPMFEGFMFYIGNPILILWYIQLIRDILKKKVTVAMAALSFGFALNLFLLCMHNTFGVYQFGARYTVDLLPYVFFYLLLTGKRKPNLAEQLLCAFGLMFNIYGAIVTRMYTKI